MKVVHINFSLGIGGVETMLVDIINEQSIFAEIHLVLINNLYDISLLKTVNTKVKIWFIGRPIGSINPLYLVKLNILLLKLKPDVVHSHNHQIINWMFFFKKNSCLTIHDVYIPVNHLDKYNKLFAISNTVRNDITLRANLPSELVYNGIYVDQVLFKSLYSCHEPFRIVQISRLMHEKKGQHILLEALSKLVQIYNFKSFHVDFIGEGESFDYLNELVSKYSLNTYVTFQGSKTRFELYNELKNYSLLVQPSLYEGFGLTVAEAMAAGVPVLVSNIEGPLELIDNEKFGFSFQVGNADRLAEMIYTLFKTYATFSVENKAIKARSYISTYFDVRQTALKYLSHYI